MYFSLNVWCMFCCSHIWSEADGLDLRLHVFKSFASWNYVTKKEFGNWWISLNLNVTSELFTLIQSHQTCLRMIGKASRRTVPKMTNVLRVGERTKSQGLGWIAPRVSGFWIMSRCYRLQQTTADYIRLHQTTPDYIRLHLHQTWPSRTTLDDRSVIRMKHDVNGLLAKIFKKMWGDACTPWKLKSNCLSTFLAPRKILFIQATLMCSWPETWTWNVFRERSHEVTCEFIDSKCDSVG